MRKHEILSAYEDYLDVEEAFESAQPQRMRRRRAEGQTEPTRSGRLTEAEKVRLERAREDAGPELPDGADRWTTWIDAEQGPHPRPDWVITDGGAADSDLGIVKTGKEADVFLLERAAPGGASCLMAAKRYRGSEHRMFHRDSGYLEGRRMRRSREMRAIANRSSFGRNLIAEQWAVAEFAALSRLWSVGAPVPYPVQRDGTELLLEFLGDADGQAAPRLAQLRPEPDEALELWEQLLTALELMAAQGLTHGDLSAYNLLVHDGHIVLIDLPQVVDLVANPAGRQFLVRDVTSVATWFRGRGLPEPLVDPLIVAERLMSAAGLE
ncbi:serine protein kinase RIO [Actinokineospora guangxiensis]|uniref:non-specific serine/threonine protein kinase n=1 Tax=Actinokineospora guangxiensis TaxID=1490288 RepID=A0ABW0EPX1_9PSEU